MNQIFASKAWLPDGWANNVRLHLSGGRIAGVESDAQAQADDQRVDCLIPGIANAHSHAFQRALVGRTERRSGQGQDDFWSWRTQMYALAARLSAEQLRAIATQLYVEMLESGYTSVAEFHYFHDDGTAMAEALIDAATASGIRLTLVPVLYERSGFDASSVLDEQRRFATTADRFLELHSELQAYASESITVGIGVHSLRAVSENSLRQVADRAMRCGCPMHIHIAEQQGEIEQCVAATGVRPVEWLLDTVDVDQNWCLVHATHLIDIEIEALAVSGAVVCLCPSTEANLGDGLFPLTAFRDAGGRIAIGSDSHVTVDPFEELRWLEYGQRLITLQRNVGSGDHDQVGADLLTAAIDGGAQACGIESGLRVGAPADLIELDSSGPALAGHDHATRLDALVFFGSRSPIKRVMVCGEWRVESGRHVHRDATATRFLEVVRAMS